MQINRVWLLLVKLYCSIVRHHDLPGMLLWSSNMHFIVCLLFNTCTQYVTDQVLACNVSYIERVSSVLCSLSPLTTAGRCPCVWVAPLSKYTRLDRLLMELRAHVNAFRLYGYWALIIILPTMVAALPGLHAVCNWCVQKGTMLLLFSVSELTV